MNQRGITLIPMLLIVAVIILLGGFVFFGIGNNKLTNKAAESDNKNTCTFNSQTVKVPLQSAEGVFANPLTEIEAIDKITPGSQTGDARLTYLWIKNNQKVPIFAPADGTLVKIAYKVRTDLGLDMSVPDYDLTFMVDCQTIYQINHITDPNAEIAALKPNVNPYQTKPGSPIDEEGTKPAQNITVKAGQQLGTTTGTPNAHAFDFGIFVKQEAVCPYQMFAEPLRLNWMAKFSDGACEVSGMF